MKDLLEEAKRIDTFVDSKVYHFNNMLLQIMAPLHDILVNVMTSLRLPLFDELDRLGRSVTKCGPKLAC